MMETNNSKEIKYYVVTEFFCSVICHIRTEYVFSLIAGKYESEKIEVQTLLRHCKALKVEFVCIFSSTGSLVTL